MNDPTAINKTRKINPTQMIQYSATGGYISCELLLPAY